MYNNIFLHFIVSKRENIENLRFYGHNFHDVLNL